MRIDFGIFGGVLGFAAVAVLAAEVVGGYATGWSIPSLVIVALVVAGYIRSLQRLKLEQLHRVVGRYAEQQARRSESRPAMAHR